MPDCPETPPSPEPLEIEQPPVTSLEKYKTANRSGMANICQEICQVENCHPLRSYDALVHRVKNRTKCLRIELVRFSARLARQKSLKFKTPKKVRTPIPMAKKVQKLKIQKPPPKSPKIVRKSMSKRVQKSTPKNDEIDENQNFIPEKIIKKRVRRNSLQYLVKYHNFDENEAVWLDEEDICDTPEDRRRLTLKFEVGCSVLSNFILKI